MKKKLLITLFLILTFGLRVEAETIENVEISTDKIFYSEIGEPLFNDLSNKRIYIDSEQCKLKKDSGWLRNTTLGSESVENGHIVEEGYNYLYRFSLEAIGDYSFKVHRYSRIKIKINNKYLSHCNDVDENESCYTIDKIDEGAECTVFLYNDILDRLTDEIKIDELMNPEIDKENNTNFKLYELLRAKEKYWIETQEEPKSIDEILKGRKMEEGETFKIDKYYTFYTKIANNSNLIFSDDLKVYVNNKETTYSKITSKEIDVFYKGGYLKLEEEIENPEIKDNIKEETINPETNDNINIFLSIFMISIISLKKLLNNLIKLF